MSSTISNGTVSSKVAYFKKAQKKETQTSISVKSPSPCKSPRKRSRVTSSKVAFFMQAQEKEANNAVSAKTAFYRAKAAGKSPSPRKRSKSKSSIRDKLAMFQKIERKGKEVVEKQDAVKQYFRLRKQSTKKQTKQKDVNYPSAKQFSVGSIVTTTSNPSLTGTVVKNTHNGMVSVKLGWATAYISKDNLKVREKPQKKQSPAKRMREKVNTMHPSKKIKTKIELQNGIEQSIKIESTLTQPSPVVPSPSPSPTPTPISAEQDNINSSPKEIEPMDIEQDNNDVSSLVVLSPSSTPAPISVEQNTISSSPKETEPMATESPVVTEQENTRVPPSTPAPISVEQNTISFSPKETEPMATESPVVTEQENTCVPPTIIKDNIEPQTQLSNVKSQPKQFSVGSTVATISNTSLTGTVVKDPENGIVPIKLEWATAYISQDNLKTVEKLLPQKELSPTKRMREAINAAHPSKKKKIDFELQIQNSIGYSHVIEPSTKAEPNGTEQKNHGIPLNQSSAISEPFIIAKDKENEIKDLPQKNCLSEKTLLSKKAFGDITNIQQSGTDHSSKQVSSMVKLNNINPGVPSNNLASMIK